MESLQIKAINRLKELGANEKLLWLVEVQTIEQAANFYGDYVEWDLCKHSLQCMLSCNLHYNPFI